MFPASREAALELSLSDLQEHWVYFKCCHTVGGKVLYYLNKCGDQNMEKFIGRLTCSECKGRAKFAHLDDASFYRPGVAGCNRLVLVGDESALIP